MLKIKLAWVALFAVAMAYVESAVVVYLRRLYGIEDLIRDFSAFDPVIGAVEVGRELATLVMLLAVGFAVGRRLQSKIGIAFFAFGVWDIAYYAWLKVFIDWPSSLIEPDILFLVPLPWWGPVIAPALIALLMVVGGALAAHADDQDRVIRPALWQWIVVILGGLVALYSFMADALAILPATAEQLNAMRPGAFLWPVYLLGLALMAWPVLAATWPQKKPPSPAND